MGLCVFCARVAAFVVSSSPEAARLDCHCRVSFNAVRCVAWSLVIAFHFIITSNMWDISSVVADSNYTVSVKGRE